MDRLIYYICIPLGYLMKGCWLLAKDYGLAIILFTLATKFVLLPISVWIQKNSILMVKIQPKINFLKVKHYGDGETIAEEQSKLFKAEKYHPMLSLIPLIIQFVLLLGVVEIIYHPLGYLFGIDNGTVRALAEFIGADPAKSSCQLDIIHAIHSGKISAASVIDGVSGAKLTSLIETVGDFNLKFLGIDLSVIPSKTLGIYILIPLIAGLSSFFLCFTQNLANVIQHEQGKLGQWGLMIISVGISLYLGAFVPTGIALYWVASNIFSIIQMYLLNMAINPKKYVDYEALEQSRKELARLEALDAPKKKDAEYRKNKAREKKDYKRFFKVVNKHVVIYSEKSGFYKYFKDLIAQLLDRSNLIIHYVTNDPNDVIFEIAEQQPRIRPYYIGLRKMIPLMSMLESDIVVMTTPDLDKYYLKRSYMKKDAEYIYLPHDMMSVHMGFREGALDAFDTIFCTGEHVACEVRATEKVYGLPEKKLVEFGYPLAEQLLVAGKEERRTHIEKPRKEVLIAPSWQEDNLLDSCIDTLIEQLYSERYHITVRPHPEYVKRYASRLHEIVDRYADRDPELLTFELDFSNNRSIYSSDLLITDWSGIAPEFCFATNRPALFINTKIKCLNENWEKIGCTPIEISLRNELGVALDKEEVDRVGDTVATLIANSDRYAETIAERFKQMIYHHGAAGEEGARYILKSLVEKRKQKG